MGDKIKRLEPQLVSRLRSGIALTCVAQCVEELVLNSVDARANCIAVRLNMTFGKIQVVDNGHGIALDDLTLIGERYATSKCYSVDDLKCLKFYGYRGEALASLQDVSANLEIATRTSKNTAETYVKSFHFGKSGGPACICKTPRPSPGTTVTVLDFLYNIPVRKNLITEARNLEHCRQRLQCIALVNPGISFSLRDDSSGEVCLQTRKCSTIRGTFTALYGHLQAENMKDFDYECGDMRLHGLLSTEGSSSKELQFLYVNRRRVVKTQLHHVVKSILYRYCFQKGPMINQFQGQKENSLIQLERMQKTIGGQFSLHQEALSNKQLDFCVKKYSQSPRKHLPQHPNYVLNLSCPLDHYDICFEPQKTTIEFLHWESVSRFVEEATLKFARLHELEELPVDPVKRVNEDGDIESEVRDDPKEYGQEIATENTKHSLHSLAAKKPRSDNTDTREIWETDANSMREHQSLEIKSDTIAVHCYSSLDRLKKKVQQMNEDTGINENVNRSVGLDSNHGCAFKGKALRDLNEFEFGIRKQSKRSMSSAGLQWSLKDKMYHQTASAEQILTITDSKQDETLIQQSPEQMEVEGPLCSNKLQQTVCCPEEEIVSKSFNTSVSETEKQGEMPRTASTGNIAIKPSSFLRGVSLEGNLEKAHFTNADEITSVGKGNDVLFASHSAEINCSSNKAPNGSRTLVEGGAILQDGLFASSTKEKYEEKSLKLSAEGISIKETGQEKFPDVEIHFPAGLRDINSNCLETVGADDEMQQQFESIAPDKTKMWIQFQDETTDRQVYINAITGNSSYDPPNILAGAENEDFVTQQSAHFFLSHDCNPFLPRPISERPAFECLPNETDGQVINMLKEWENPVSKTRGSEEVIGITATGSCKNSAVKVYNMMQQYRFTKNLLQNVQFIGQVDCKFLACLMSYECDRNLLVLFDQHAVHERIRLEKFIEELYEDAEDGRRIVTSEVKTTIRLQVSPDIARKAKIYSHQLSEWGIELSVDSDESLGIHRVPKCLTRKGSPNELAVQNLVTELLDTLHETGSLSTLPKTILEILSSRACHGAVKFGDRLEAEEAEELISVLPKCKLPFQCAHGRPSIAPILDLRHLPSMLGNDDETVEKLNLERLRAMT